jgi:HEAT repeats
MKASAQYLVLLTLAVSVFSSRATFAADPVQMSAAFERFKYSFFEDPTSAQDAQRQLEWNPLGLLFLFRALWLIDPDPRWPAPAIDVLGSAHDWVHRQEAAEALGVMHTPEVVAALTKALDDEDAPVRFSAARGLLAIYGLSDDPVDIQSMVYRVMADDAGRRASGKRDVLAAIAGRAMAGP